MVERNAISELVGVLAKGGEKRNSDSFNAVVSRVDNEGVVWVVLAGSERETPTASTSTEVKRGDSVTVQWRDNKLYIGGNYSNPAVGIARMAAAEYRTEQVFDIAENAEDIAIKAGGIADNTNQYFWVAEAGSDTGVHITEVPREEFLADPENGGGNLLARSNGLAMRDGLTEVATFSKDAVKLGKETSGTFAGASITNRSIEFNPRFGSSAFKFRYADAGIVVTQKVIGTGDRLVVSVCRPSDSIAVTVDGVATTSFSVLFPTSENYGTLTFRSPYPADGAEVIITYTTLNELPVYQFGVGTPSGPFSSVNGLLCEASGIMSHAEGNGTIASGFGQSVMGRYNVDNANYAVIIGNGSNSARSNAVAADWDGNLRIAGGLYVGCDPDSGNGIAYAVKRALIGASSSADITLERGKCYRVVTAAVPASTKGEYIVSVSSAGTVGAAPVRTASDLTISGSNSTMTITNGNASYAVAVRVEEI